MNNALAIVNVWLTFMPSPMLAVYLAELEKRTLNLFGVAL